MTKSATLILCVSLALAAGTAARAESKVAKRFDAGPAIQGNAGTAMPSHRRRATAPGTRKRAL